MKARHLCSLNEISVADVKEILALAKTMKKNPQEYRQALAGKTLAMIFQKPSTRTRVSFQVGMYQLGGMGLVLGQHELQLGRGETVADTAKVLSRYVDGIMARVFGHNDILALRDNASVPVINGLSDLYHPCQALADYQTIEERFGTTKDIHVVYVGDGNNVAHSLAHGASRLGARLTILTPAAYPPNADVIEIARTNAKETGATIAISHDPKTALKGAHVVYTDVWASMGQEKEHAQRLKDFSGFQVNQELFDRAAPNAIFMHCLPAHRGEEVTDEVVDHERSVVLDQAENRLHAQKALLALLMG